MREKKGKFYCDLIISLLFNYNFICRLAPTCCNIEHYINNIIFYEEISVFSGQVHLNLKNTHSSDVLLQNGSMFFFVFF